MLLAAELCALPAIDAHLLRPEPRIAHETRDRICLTPSAGTHHAWITSPRGDQQTHFGIDGHDERIVDLEQVVLALWLAAFDLRERRGEVRVIAEALLQVIVVPLPLEARDLDRHVGRRRVLERKNRFRRGERHEQQDQEGITVQMISTVVLS
jgi:hypothetical protein